MKTVKNFFKGRNVGLLAVIAALLVFMAVKTPQFFSTMSILNTLRSNSIYLFMAVAEAIVMITGCIDISGASTIAFCGLFVCNINKYFPSIPVIVLVLLATLMGLLIGIINGLLVGKMNLNPMIATLGTQYIVRGFAFVTTNGTSIPAAKMTAGFKAAAGGRVMNIPVIIIYSLIVFAIVALLLNKCTTGRRFYSVGSSRLSTEIAGFKSSVIIIKAYAIAGLIYGFAGFCYISATAAGRYNVASGYEMTAIACCVLGGVSIMGGSGKMGGVFLAYIIMTLITTLISMLRGMGTWKNAILGGLIIISIAFNIYLEAQSRKKALKERDELL